MFGSGGSHILKFNRNQVLERRKFKNISETYGESDRELGGNEMTPAKLERFKIELQEKRRRERFIKGLVLFVISFSVVTVFVLVLR
jgi:uncharacterized membrane protein YqjE